MFKNQKPLGVSRQLIYRYYTYWHAFRVGLALATALALGSWLPIPHTLWINVSVVIVLGGLAYTGDVLNKAYQRAIGTAVGALLGIVVVVFFHMQVWLGYLFIIIGTMVCCYYAIGKGGYIGLLAAATISIVAGEDPTSYEAAIWRTINVFIGILLAVFFILLFPTKATYRWRTLLVENLAELAALHALLAREEVEHVHLLQAPTRRALFDRLNKRLIAQRSLLASVHKETRLPKESLENLQASQRALIIASELLSSVDITSRTKEGLGKLYPQCHAEQDAILETLRSIIDVLSDPGITPVDSVLTAKHLNAVACPTAEPTNAEQLAFNAYGYTWLSGQLLTRLTALKQLVNECVLSAKY